MVNVVAFQIKSTLQVLQSILKASGYTRLAQIGEPKGAISERVAAALFNTSAHVTRLTLGGSPGTEESHLVTIRFYMNMLDDPQEDIEFLLMEAVSNVSEAILNDFDLGATVRHVDVAGINGQPLAVTYGYLEQHGVMYRVADLLVPLMVDNPITLVV